MGKETVRLLMEHNLISDFDDMFELTKDELLTLEGFEETKATKLIKAILVATKVPLDRLLIGLGIMACGRRECVPACPAPKQLRCCACVAKKMSADELSKIDGIGTYHRKIGLRIGSRTRAIAHS